MPKIKLNYPNGDVLAETLYRRLAPQPGDIVVVFDSSSLFISKITILDKIDDNECYSDMPFVAAIDDGKDVFNWTYAYKVPEGYASVETSND